VQNTAAGSIETQAKPLNPCMFAQVLEEFRREMDKAGVPPRASLVLMVACTGEVPIISDEKLDAFAQIGHALAPEKVRFTCRRRL
jgi:hypothetical protein